MTDVKKIEVSIEEKPTVNNFVGLESLATNNGSPENPALSDRVLKSIAFFGSTGALVFFGLLIIFPSE